MSSALAGHWLVRALGWAIVHSLWQGALIAVIVALLLRAFARSSANVRYLLACAGLVAMTASWTLTAVSNISVPSKAHGAPSLAIADGVAAVSDLPLAIQVDDARPTSTHRTAAWSWRARLESWSAAIVLMWVIGVALLSLRVAFGWHQVRQLRATHTEGVAEAVRLRARAIADRLRVSRPFQIAQSAAVQVPTVVGSLHPLVLLPLSALSGLSSAQLDAIIAHELAHVRRHDYLVNIMQTAVEVLLFYHPACWWISRQIRAEREHCCDDLVVMVCGDPVGYATALTELETRRGRTAAFSLAATDGPLLRRVRRLLTSSATANESGPSWMAALVPMLVLALALTGVNAAQSPTPSAPRAVRATEGVIEGQVVDAASGRPLRAATVEMIGPQRAITLSTGDDGKYEASGLEPGKYRISAKLAGYVTAHFGSRSRNDIGVLAEASGGRVTSGIDLRLQAAGGITGRVFDEHGEGLSEVEVQLVAQTSTPGLAGPVAVDFAQTVAGGEFRFAEIVPGEYWVRAYKAGPGGAHDGREPMALALRELRDRTASGPLARSAYGSTFYPGVTHLEEAQPVRVDAGGELVGIDFALAAMPTRRVAGRVLDEQGRPATQVQIRMHSMAGINASHAEYTSGAGRNGRFAIEHVVPGDYMLMVVDPSAPWRWTSTVRRITVDEEDLTDVEIRARAGAHIEGRVTRESGVTRALDPNGLRVMFERAVVDAGKFIGGGRPVEADGTFSFDAPSGPVTVAIPTVPKGWMVRRIVIDGKELDDQPFELGENARHHVDVVLTDRLTQVLGIARDAKGRAVLGVDVFVFPDRAPALSWSPGSRSMRQVRSDMYGRFQVDALPPGDYLAVALDQSAPFLIENAALLQQLSRSATRVRLGDGERRAIEVRVAALPATAASR